MCVNVIRDTKNNSYQVTICVSRVVCSMELRQLINHIGGRLIHCQCMVVKFRHRNAGTVGRSLLCPIPLEVEKHYKICSLH